MHHKSSYILRDFLFVHFQIQRGWNLEKSINSHFWFVTVNFPSISVLVSRSCKNICTDHLLQLLNKTRIFGKEDLIKKLFEINLLLNVINHYDTIKTNLLF